MCPDNVTVVLEGQRKERVKGRGRRNLRENGRGKERTKEGRVNDEGRKRVDVTRGIGGERKTGGGERGRKE